MSKGHAIKALIMALCLSLVPVLAHTERDYPHNSRYGIECLTCHWVHGSGEPDWATHVPLDIDDTPYNNLCWSCHDNSEAPFKNTHSSLQTDDDYGDWSIQCMTCHYPHRQAQYEVYGSEGFIYDDNSTNIEAGVPEPIYSRLTDSGASWTANEFQGMLLIPNTSLTYPFSYNYLIKENDSTTITVRGVMPVGTDINIGDPYAVIYGKLVNDVIDAPDRPTCSVVDNEYVCADTIEKTVKFLGPTGSNSFADGDGTYDGVCEVCHTMTDHFRNDGNAPDQLHTNVEPSPVATDCTECHVHLTGFGHGQGGTGCEPCHGHDAGYEYSPGLFSQGRGTSSTHSTHTENDSDDLRGPNVPCSDCHDTSNFPYFKSGTDGNGDGKIVLSETDVCNNCHSPGGSFNGVTTTGSSIGAKDNWEDGVYTGNKLDTGKEKWCAGCHDSSPANSKQDGSGVTARNITGDNSSYGFYASGHARNGKMECNHCHDLSKQHIDHLYTEMRDMVIFTADPNPTNYRFYDDGRFRLPRTKPYQSYDFELCYKCHDSNLFDNNNLSAGTTNFRDENFTDLNEDPYPLNLHWYHAYQMNTSYSCAYCHSVHGTREYGTQEQGDRMLVIDNARGMVDLVFLYLNSGDGKYYQLSDSSKWNDPAENKGMAMTDSAACANCHGDIYADAINAALPTGLGPAHNQPDKWGWYFRDFYTEPMDDAKASCEECHGHDPDWPGVTGGGGTYEVHSIHTEDDDPEEYKGPNTLLVCGDCHDTTSYPDFSDGVTYEDYKSGAEMTTVCDTCHSPDGDYDGVNDAVVGAKNNWTSGGVYETDGSLKSGREKWCATCHDKVPSRIMGVDAPNVIGDESVSYTYGTGYGFYKTGHGLPATEYYPASGGVTSGAGKECLDCHISTVAHIDGDPRTFDDNNSGTDQSDEYRIGFRLTLVGGQEPMIIPKNNDGNDADDYRLCLQAGCHLADSTERFFTNDLTKTNMRTGTTNRHWYHLDFNNAEYSPDWDFGGNVSEPSCVTCHNVHGSVRFTMMRDGKLTNKEVGFEMWYYNADVVYYDTPTYTDPPSPDDLPLTASTGVVWNEYSARRFCAAGCHSPDALVVQLRDPYQDVDKAPTLDWTGDYNYAGDGADPDTAPGESSFEFRVEYTDLNNDPPSVIEVWIDLNDDTDYDDPGEKLSMSGSNAADVNYTDGKDYSKTVTISKAGDNTLMYRFYAKDSSTGELEATLNAGPITGSVVTLTNNVPVLGWTGETDYASDGVDPDSGLAGSGFEFRVKYTDTDTGECPTVIEAWVDADDDLTGPDGYEDPSERHAMTEVNAGDTDCTDGKLYTWTETLSTAGDLNYRFYATDGTDTATGNPTADSTVNVYTGTNSLPRLDWVTEDCRTKGVKPVSGLSNGDFEFKIRYTDADNQCPASGSTDIQVWIDDDDDNGSYSGGEMYNLIEADASDTDCTDGKIYKLTRQVVYVGDGELIYRFYANDGTDTVETADNTVTALNIANAKGVRQGSETGPIWYGSIQDAIDAVNGAHQVFVYEGTYNERAYFNGANDNDTTVQSVCGPELTIINNSTEVAYFLSNTGSVLDGFTLTGGTTGVELNSSNPTLTNLKIHSISGRGIDTGNSGSTLDLSDSEVYSNTGRGIYINGGSGHTVDNSIIRDNTGGDGGGVYALGHVTFTDTTIRDNSSSGAGGGVFLNGVSGDFYRCTITGNTASGRSGAVELGNSSASVYYENSVVADNQGTFGGVTYLNGGTLEAVYSTFADNRATNDGGAFYSNSGTINVRDSIFWNNIAGGTGHITHFNWGSMSITDSIMNNDGDGDFEDQPYFAGSALPTVNGYTSENDPAFVDPSSGNYHIKSYSDAVDNAGQTSTSTVYNVQSNSGTTVATGITTNAPGSCAGATSEVTTLMSSSSHNCASQSVSISSAGTLLEAYYNKAYENSTSVAGTSFKIRLTDDGGGWQAGVQLFRVNSSGTKTNFGGAEVTQSVSAGGDSTYTLDLSGQSATIPAGSKLGVRVRVISGSSPNMKAYWGYDADTAGTGTSGVLTVAELKGAGITDDIDSESRPQGGANDIGADEYTSAARQAPVLAWTGEAGYEDDGADPDSGPGETSFEFRVSYTDADNNAPASIELWIDEDDNGSYESDEKYPMSEVNASDTDYTDGKLYTKGLAVSHAGNGTLNYRFYASDGELNATGAPTSDSAITISNNVPVLEWTNESAEYASDGVDPDSAEAGTSFIFRVKYTDLDNNPPVGIQVWVDENDMNGYEAGEMYDMTVDGGDSDYTNGEIFTKTLDLGFAGDGGLDYRFYAYDSYAFATGDPNNDSTVTVTVPGVSFTVASQVTPDESVADYTITAQLSGTSDVAVTVPFSINGASTAADPADYSITSSPLTIPAGDLTADITVSVASDTEVEGNETVIVDMGTPTNAVQGSITQHTLNITDDDSISVTFTTDAQTTAGESGTATITAQLSQTSGSDVTVPFTVNGSSTAADPADYTITASPIIITAGNLSEDITVTIAADSLDENNETVIVDMGTPTGAEQGGITTHTVTITDDDPTPTVTFTSGSQSVTENDTTATVTAQLSAVSGLDVTVPFSVDTDNSTAEDPADYEIEASPLTITAGSLSDDITITIYEDTENEGDETVIVDMGTPTNATPLAPTQHTLTITDDDAGGTTHNVCPTEAAPYDTIQGGIGAATTNDGDTLLVCDGTYSENIDFLGKNITVRSVNGAGSTTIQGQYTWTNDAVVSFENSVLTSSAVLDGFTIDSQMSANGNTRGVYITGGASPAIQNCIIEDNAHGYGVGGGAMYITGTDSGATISNTTIQNNTSVADNGAGGIYMAGTGTLAISGSTIENNSASSTNGSSSGGGIKIASGTVDITDSEILSNSCAVAVGGIHVMSGASLTLSESYVMGNRTYGPSNWSDGGGIKIASGGTATITNSVIAGNTADNAWQADGGGIHNEGTLNLYFSTVADNFAEYRGGGLYAGGTENIYNSIIWGNSYDHTGPAEIYDANGLEKDETNEYSSDPSFVSRSAATSDNPTTDGNYYLLSTSNCIDTGNDKNAPAGDIVGTGRPVDIEGVGDGIDDYDKGAYEFYSTPAIAGGADHSVALKIDGTVYAWGLNSSGQIGDGTTNDALSPTQVSGLTDVTMIATAAGGNFNLALKSDGTVYGWGENNVGQLGRGTTSAYESTAAAVSGLTGVVSIAAGAQHGLAVKSDGTVWAWGADTNGQLGNGDITGTQTSPIQVSTSFDGTSTYLTDVSKVGAGPRHSLAVKNDGTLWTWGMHGGGFYPIDHDDTARVSSGPSSGWNYHYAMEESYGYTNYTEVVGGGYFDGSTYSQDYTIALRSDGSVLAWGRNDYLQLDMNTVTGVSEVSAGGYHSLATLSAGTVKVSGADCENQHGDGRSCCFCNAIGPTDTSNIINIISTGGGGFHGLAVEDNAGTIKYWGWGMNDQAQLGQGAKSSTDERVPVEITLP